METSDVECKCEVLLSKMCKKCGMHCIQIRIAYKAFMCELNINARQCLVLFFHIICWKIRIWNVKSIFENSTENASNKYKHVYVWSCVFFLNSPRFHVNTHHLSTEADWPREESFLDLVRRIMQIFLLGACNLRNLSGVFQLFHILYRS